MNKFIVRKIMRIDLTRNEMRKEKKMCLNVDEN